MFGDQVAWDNVTVIQAQVKAVVPGSVVVLSWIFVATPTQAVTYTQEVCVRSVSLKKMNQGKSCARSSFASGTWTPASICKS